MNIKNIINDVFYFSISTHQILILKEKGLACEIVNLPDLEAALKSGIRKLVIFNDTIPGVMRLIKKFNIEAELWQEGLVPFHGFVYNYKSFVRNRIFANIPCSLFDGYRPYFYNGCKLIRTAYPETSFNGLKSGVKVIQDCDIFKYSDALAPVSDHPIYAATDLHSSRLMADHHVQINNFLNLRKLFPNLRFRPHPSEFNLFSKIFPDEYLSFDFKYSNLLIGTISTLLYINMQRGGKSILFLQGHTKILHEISRLNVIPFLKGCEIYERFNLLEQSAGSY